MAFRPLSKMQQMGEATTVRLHARTGLRAKLVRAMVVTLVVVTSATVLTVGYMHYRNARSTLEAIELRNRQNIARKGQWLVTNHALALRGLVADNAFGDVARLVERSVREDEEMLYGVFFGADGKVWAYVPPPALAANPFVRPDVRELGIDPTAAARPGHRPDPAACSWAGGVRVLRLRRRGRRRRAGPHRLRPVQCAAAARTVRGARRLPSNAGADAGVAVGVGCCGDVARHRDHPRRRGADHPAARPLDRGRDRRCRGRRNKRFKIWTDDEIGVLGGAFNQMLQELDNSYKNLESLNRTLENRVEARTRELGHRNRDMRLVLDNVNQGFLTMSRNGMLAEERSAIVTRWLGPSPPQQTFAAYVGGRDRTFAEAFQLGYEVLLEGLLPLELCLDQLPKRLRHDGRELEFSYHAIQEQGVDRNTLHGLPNTLHGLLIVINDITEQLQHARQEADRAELLAMVQGFMTDRSGFMAFFDEVTHLLETYGDPESDLMTRKRALHTIKGNAGLAGFRVVADLCHRAEEQLADGDETQVADTSRALVARWQTLGDTLATLLGERGRDVVEVQAGELAGLIDELRGTGAPDRIFARLSEWTLEPAERPLERLARHARSLAQRLGKGEIRVDVEGGGVRVDPQHWKGLWSELVHVVRNAIDHGMEPPDERRATGKPPQPRLGLRTATIGERLIIEIEDDGRGVDWEAVRVIAREKGMPCGSPEELTAVLLAADVTTLSKATLTSGRGMGLASVADRVRELGGNIAVKSHKGKGTQIRVSLPLTTGAPIRTEPVPASSRNVA
jgi:two-component system chemotaxis sensor kinase CheA